MKRAWLVLALALASIGATACKPPAVVALDQWLLAYQNDDLEPMIEATWSGDRELLRAAMLELREVPTGTLASSLPPRPLEHEVLDVDSKSDDGLRWVLLAKTTLKNPLPFASEKVGHVLEGMPKTRDQRRKYLLVREREGEGEGERWGVKLDLEKTVARAKFVVAFQRLLARGQLDEAEQLLAQAPEPPDEANAQKKSDRLLETLRAELTKARKKD